MATIKPIQATPELSGKDAVNLLIQVNSKATNKAVKKNGFHKIDKWGVYI